MPREDRLKLKVRWRRYATPELLERAFRRVHASAEGWPTRATKVSPDLLRSIKRNRMWAFVDLHAPGLPPVVHYWHAANVRADRLAFMLGHELGHTVGKRSKFHRLEEDRADEYGRVAHAVLLRLRKGNR